MTKTYEPIPHTPEPSRFPSESILPPLAVIVAMTVEGVIGYAGGMPWHEPADLRYFRQRTLGHAILMGRVTYESIGRPLPDRRNLILSQRSDLHARGCEVFADLATALVAARTEDPCPVVIGGAKLYAATLPLATRLYVTEIGCAVHGDTFFPPIEASSWCEIECFEAQGQAGPLRFLTLARTHPTPS